MFFFSSLFLFSFAIDVDVHPKSCAPNSTWKLKKEMTNKEITQIYTTYSIHFELVINFNDL